MLKQWRAKPSSKKMLMLISADRIDLISISNDKSFWRMAADCRAEEHLKMNIMYL